MTHYTITPAGGAMWTVRQDGEYLGFIESGTVGDDGQWIGDYDDVEAEARKAFPIPFDATVEVD